MKTESRDPDTLLAALKAGDFYLSTGPAIENIEIVGNEFVLTTTPPSGVLANSNHAEMA